MPTNTSCPRLCGGVFFELLLHAKKQRIKARDTYLGKNDGLSEPESLKGLIKVLDPNYQEPYASTFKTNTTDYKKCRISAGTYLPFTHKPIVTAFDDAVKNDYHTTLARMIAYADRFIDMENASSFLCKALLALIDLDDSIPDDAKFYVVPAGCAITKAQLKQDKHIYFQALLLGVWHFIILNRPDNSVGKSTAEAIANGTAIWCTEEYFTSLTDNDGRRFYFTDKEKYGSAETESDETPEQPERPSAIVDYTDYLSRIQEKYGYIKTLLYNDEPHKFYDFYVCNDVFQNARVAADGEAHPLMRHFENFNLEQILKCSNFVLLTGTGGLGKSMMMRHLLLDTAKRFGEVKRVPVFIALKDYGANKADLFDIILDALHNFGATTTREELEADLVAGNFLLLLDGLDEIGVSVRADFERKIDAFIDRYSKNVFVLSSRPFNSFVYLTRFTVLRLCPFNKRQALQLIEKLDFRPDEPQIKKRFMDELDARLFETHNDFATNPLLLTIMLMTYEQYAEVPSKMHIFYQEAYVTLSQKHDASKGAYKRPLRTGLTADRFADYFAEFCAKTYLQEKFELTETEIEDYYMKLKVREKDGNTSTASDFIEDLTSNLCLMYYEDGKYQFTHRSFQEYFCAKCFSHWKDKNLSKVGEFFEDNKDRVEDDLTFNMLYDMIPDKVEEYIFCPFLTDLFAKCDAKDGYWTFLQLVYPNISYAVLEDSVKGHGYPNSPVSYIYEFIATDLGLNKGENVDYLMLPAHEDLIQDEFIGVENAEKTRALFLAGLKDPEHSDDDEMVLARFGVPKHCGWLYSFNVSEILAHKEQYVDIISALDAEDFPMKTEYYSMRRYQMELSRQHSASSDDLFDLF